MGEAERDISVALHLLWYGTLEVEFVSKTKNKNKDLALFDSQLSHLFLLWGTL